MCSSSRWIKTFVKITEWEWHSDPVMVSVWIHLLVMANYKDEKWRGKTIPRGSFVTTLAQLAEFIGITINKLRYSLNRLIFAKQITKQSNNQFTLITITNYDSYQSGDNEVSQTISQTVSQTNHKRITNDTLYNKVEYIELSSSSPPARTREEEEILAFEKMADDVKKNCPIWIDDMAAKLHCSSEQVCKMIDTDFRKHCFDDAHPPHFNLRDFQSHFNRWATIQQNQSKNESQPTRKDKFERRRGVEPKLSQDPKDWSM